MAPSTEVPELEPVISNRKGRPRASTLEAQRATPKKLGTGKSGESRPSPFSEMMKFQMILLRES